MRIAFLTHQFPGVRLGGIGAYTLQAAAALADAGHEVHVFTLTLPNDARPPARANLHIHEVADLAARMADGLLPPPLAAALSAGDEAVYRLALGALLCQELRAVHARVRFDIIEAAEYEALALPLLMDRLPGVPVVTHIHSGSAIRRVGNHLPASTDALVFEALEFAAICAADALCAATQKVVEDTRALVAFGGEVATIPLPFNFAEAAAHVPPKSDGPILYIGRLEALKGVEVLARALLEFLPANPEARVQLAGPDTNTAPSVAQDASSERPGASMAAHLRAILGPLSARVDFLGEQSRSELAALLSRASFVVIPSLFDNFPYVLCETLAAGRGVVVSDAIGAVELAGDAGVLFRRGDAASLAESMQGLFRDPDKIRALAARAHVRARKVLANPITIPQRVAFYRKAIAGVGTAPRGAFVERLGALPPSHLAALVPTLIQLTATLAGVPLPSRKSPGTRLLKLLTQISRDGISEDSQGAEGEGGHHQAMPSKVDFMLYGAGRHTARLLSERHLWEAQGHCVRALIDDHPRFRNDAKFLGISVLSREQAELQLSAARDTAAAIVVLSTDTFEEQFYSQTEGLRALGARVYKLYT